MRERVNDSISTEGAPKDIYHEASHPRQPLFLPKNDKTSYMAAITSISTVILLLHEFGSVCPLSRECTDWGFRDSTPLSIDFWPQQLAGTDVLRQLYD
jgi:hypothetical protein